MKIFFARTFAIALVLVMTATGLWAAGAEEAPAAAADKKYVTDPTSGRVFTAPEYGGTLTFVRPRMPKSTDTWFDGAYAAWAFISPVLEKLSIGNWAIDRQEHAWNTTNVPLYALKGALG